MLPATSPTRIRYLIVAVTSITAIFMYMDRGCISQLKTSIGVDLGLDKKQMNWIMSAFFWSYALMQVPGGFIGSRFGLRHSLAVMLFMWSLFTVVSGWVVGFGALFAARLAVGIAEAGAYPSAASIVKGWFPLSDRSRANGFVALGGRVGLVLSQLLTPLIAGYAFFGWRGVLILYGVLGMVWSIIFWFIVRDKAKLHPWANAGEAEYAGEAPVSTTNSGQWPLWSLMTSRDMWLFGLLQFGSNMGWAFLITNLAEMLEFKFNCDNPEERGRISSIPPAASCFGMLAGAFIGDWCVKHFGITWGRRLPISSMLFIAGLAYIACVWITNPWHVAIALAVMAICVDIGVPSLWAFAQDVGGKHAGATLGWGNMIGNLGAGASAIVLGEVQDAYGYNAMFWTCAGFFILASFAALLLRPTKPVIDD